LSWIRELPLRCQMQAKYDVPAVINGVLAQTGLAKVSYIGHSQGTLIGFVGFSTNQTLARQVDVMAALAPVGVLQHSVTHIGKLLEKTVQYLCRLDAEQWSGDRGEICGTVRAFATARRVLPTLCKVGGVPGYRLCIDAVCELAGCESVRGYVICHASSPLPQVIAITTTSYNG
jgi:pimeloyl-ACP methyl ester carboxylesterase